MFDLLFSLSSHFGRFNYRSTHHLVSHGFYNFLNWFDERAWYPLGRIVGGTVSSQARSVVWTTLCTLCYRKPYLVFKNLAWHLAPMRLGKFGLAGQVL